jgi:RND family efflux transporter MFP subunit
VASFVETMHVDRGSVVRKGQPLVTLSAPELQAQIAESESKAQAVQLQLAEARAKLLGAQTTYEMLRNASATQGAVSVSELTLSEKAYEGAQAVVEAVENSARAAQSAADAMAKLGAYLQVTAPFDGIVTERLSHPGALVGPGTGGVAAPLLYLEQTTRLRLVVAVPEAEVAGVSRGAIVRFTVPAYPGETFEGTISRIPQSLDSRTRSMAVEADVQNREGRLSAGMYADVAWPVRMQRAALLVPPSSVVMTTERHFVIRLRDGRAEWVTVTRGPAVGETVEVHGALQPGDVIVRRGTDEIREGTPLVASR